MSNHAYGNLQLSRLETVDRHTMTGLAGGNTAGRLSHAFDLRDPSLAVASGLPPPSISAASIGDHSGQVAARRSTTNTAPGLAKVYELTA
ncbi:hypothetical protein [Streptomyces sp. NPDC051173]|uniref:hypothetical protein n=1 Tax=Streptomyces sp. NPDC051173 TaxID=3155164 RepID=UPI00344B51F3